MTIDKLDTQVATVTLFQTDCYLIAEALSDYTPSGALAPLCTAVDAMAATFRALAVITTVSTDACPDDGAKLTLEWTDTTVRELLSEAAGNGTH